MDLSRNSKLLPQTNRLGHGKPIIHEKWGEPLPRDRLSNRLPRQVRPLRPAGISPNHTKRPVSQFSAHSETQSCQESLAPLIRGGVKPIRTKKHQHATANSTSCTPSCPNLLSFTQRNSERIRFPPPLIWPRPDLSGPPASPGPAFAGKHLTAHAFPARPQTKLGLERIRSRHENLATGVTKP